MFILKNEITLYSDICFCGWVVCSLSIKYYE